MFVVHIYLSLSWIYPLVNEHRPSQIGVGRLVSIQTRLFSGSNCLFTRGYMNLRFSNVLHFSVAIFRWRKIPTQCLHGNGPRFVGVELVEDHLGHSVNFLVVTNGVVLRKITKNGFIMHLSMVMIYFYTFGMMESNLKRLAPIFFRLVITCYNML